MANGTFLQVDAGYLETLLVYLGGSIACAVVGIIANDTFLFGWWFVVP